MRRFLVTGVAINCLNISWTIYNVFWRVVFWENETEYPDISRPQYLSTIMKSLQVLSVN